MESEIKRNLSILSSLLDLNDKTGINKTGQTYSEWIYDSVENQENLPIED